MTIDHEEDEAIDKELAPLETVSEILAYTYRCRGGEPALRTLLDLFQSSSSPCYQENLEEYASEIAEAGMSECAAIVAEYAAQAEPDLRHYVCPYPPDDHPFAATHKYSGGIANNYNAKCWLQTQKWRYPSFDESKVVYTIPKTKPDPL
jgi:hypothetical protein